MFLFHAGYIIPSNQSSALHATEGVWCEKNVKTLLQRERDHQLNLNLLMTSFRIFLPTMQLDNGIL